MLLMLLWETDVMSVWHNNRDWMMRIIRTKKHPHIWSVKVFVTHTRFATECLDVEHLVEYRI